MKKSLFVLFLLVALPIGVAAQLEAEGGIEPEEVSEALVSSHFWIAVLAGLALALAFQLLLSGLSTAIGLSAFEIKAPRKGRKGYQPASEPSEGFHPTARKLTSGFGAWWLVTTAICTFFATWLAVELAVTATAMTGVVLGLTIWGLFFISLAMFEALAGMSLFGSAFAMIGGASKAAFEGVKSMFGKSDVSKAGDIAERITREVTQELSDAVDTGDLKDLIDRYVQDLSGPDPKEIRKELEKLLDDTEIKALIENEKALDQDEINRQLGVGPGSAHRTEGVVNRIKNVISSMRSDGGNGGDGRDRVDRVTDAMLEAAGVSRRDTEQARSKVMDMLRSTNKESLSPEGFRRDLNKMMESPKQGAQAIAARLSTIDREDIATVLSQRTDMNHDEARRQVDTVYGVIENITAPFRQSQGQSTTTATQSMKNRLPDMGDSTESAKRKVTNTIRNYLNDLDRPELNYEGVRRDVRRLFNDPKAGADALYNRMKRMDRDSIKALVASIKGVSNDDAERIVSTIEETRDETMAKAQQIRDEVERRLEEAREEAYHQADEIRRDAATAAWWMFGAAAASGITAAIGGLLAVTL